MNQITLLKRDGSTLDLFDKTIPRTVLSAKQNIDLLNKNVVNLSLKSALPLNIEIGDKINVFGRTYKLNLPAKEQKLNAHLFVYNAEFEGVMYDLIRATYDINIDTTGADVQGESLTGDLRRFMNVLIENANRVFPGKWVLGVCPDTDTRTLTFDDSSNCLSMLQMFCKEFDQEFDIAEASDGTNTINIGTVGTIIPFTFKYGMGNGLYDLTREKVSSSNIVNRLKVYGSTKNITSRYRSTKLCLPGKTKSQSYIEDSNSIAQFGVWENTKTFEEVYPHRIGTVTALGSTVYKFVDTAMFDLNEKGADNVTTKYLLPGLNAKIHFNTGNLAGYEFDISDYNHASHTFTIVKQTDQRSMSFPSESSSAFQIGVGDEYVLLDIALPQSYIDTAETDLLDKGVAYLGQNCQPKVQYSLSIEKKFLKTIATAGTNIFSVGDYVPIQDSDIAVDKSIRIKSFTRNLIDEYEYTLTIADLAVQRSIYQQIVSDINDIDKIITINDLRDPAKARRNWLSAQEVLGMVFDPEGDYYTDKIKPESVDTVMLSVGAKSMQFGLVGTVFQPNYGGNKNRIVYKGGVLTHYAIVDANKVPRSWTLTDRDQTLLSDGQAYYIYAKCEKAGSGGSILFLTSQITVESDPSYYHFWIGVINSVDTSFNARSIALTYGFTTINGKYITTGAIKSADGSCVVDLDGNLIDFGDANSSLSWNKNGDKKLRIKGTIVQDSGGNESDINVDRGLFSIAETYYIGNILQYNGATYRCNINNTSGILPTNASYYTVYAAKGETGAPGAAGPQGVPGAPGSNGQTYYTWIKYADTSTGGGISNDPTNKTYIGFAYNKTTATESNTPADYMWSLIKGDKGDTGVQGATGSNGETYYTWIKYSNNADGTGLYDVPNANTKYIGIAVNKTTAAESSVKTDYTWSQFKGDTGDTGPQGDTGNTIVSMWAKNGSMTVPPNINKNEANPSGWSTTMPTATESSVKTDYTWSQFKRDTGATGSQGVAGAPGADGITYYTWIRYADTSTGGGISNDPTNKTYIGFAYNKTTATESNTPADYMWSLIKGDKGDTGVQGATGSNGETYYTWIKYSDNADGTGLYDVPTANTKYIGIAVNKTMVTYLEYVWEVKAEKKANGQLVGTWSAPVRISGIGGGSPVGGLDYDPLKKYVGSPIKCDVVKYNGEYYIARIDAGTIPAGTLPTNVSYFNSFGSSFESLATAFLWTENARIANFVFDNQKMVSQAKTNGLANLELDGISGLIKMLKAEIGLFKVVNGDIIGFDANGNERSRFSAEVLPSIADLNQGWTVISGGREYYDNDVFERDDSTGLNKKSGTYVFDFSVTVSQACNIRLGTQGGNCVLTPHPAGVTVSESNSLAILKNGSVIQQGTLEQIYYLTAGKYTFRWNYTVTANGMRDRTYIEVAINMGYQGIEAQVTPARTLIGSDGLYSVFSGGEYIYFKNGYGFEAKAGNYGIQITTAGVKKRSGSSWTLVNW